MKILQTFTLTTLLVVQITGCGHSGARTTASEQSQSGLSKAQSLVAEYARHVGADDSVHQTLDAQGDRSFGDFGFRYLPQQDAIQVRIFIVRTLDKDYPERMPQIMQVRNALTDPKIGGHYETDGAVFFHDQDQERLYLIKSFAVSTTTSAQFNQNVDRLRTIGARWFYSWFGHVAVQAFGKESVPAGQVSLASDPYNNGAPANGRDASGIKLPQIR